MEEEAKTDKGCHCRLWDELQEKAKDDPELARHLEAAECVIEKYSETLKRLADR
jgi:hypothetical protein